MLLAVPAALLAGRGRVYANPNVVQEHYRWRNDNGSESAATWKAAQDTRITGQDRNENIRLRFAIANTAQYTSADNYQYLLEYSTGTTGPWAAVPVSAGSDPFEMTATSYYADGANTTNQLTGSGTFAAGRCVEDTSNATANYSLSQGDYTEFEYCFQATSNALRSGTYYFRLTNDRSDLDGYDRYAEVVIAPATPTPSVAPTPTVTPSVTPTPNAFKTPSPTPSVTPTPFGFQTPTPTPSVTPSATVTPTPPLETFLSTGDSYVVQNQGDTNYGTETTMEVRSYDALFGAQNRRSFVEFDLSSISSAATILSATTRLYLATAPAGSRYYDLHRVTASWTETGITWNNQPAAAGNSERYRDHGNVGGCLAGMERDQ